ncbi:MAG: hypothetical protein HONBIEJF_02529 [Fimbriimonadaceae bacterium]|nr:hypothetical protein [Fimbriimonadaceae bacterium]
MSFSLTLQKVFGEAKSESDVHPHSPVERAHLFHSFDGGSTEIEVLTFLNALVLLFKPTTLLETGSGQGYGTIALAAAIKENGFGKLQSLEFDSNTAREALAKLQRFDDKLLPLVDIHVGESLDFLSGYDGPPFDFAFFDSDLKIRHREFEILKFRDKLRPGAVCVFHDTSRHRGEYLHDFNAEMIMHLDVASNSLERLESNLSRGVRLIRL